MIINVVESSERLGADNLLHSGRCDVLGHHRPVLGEQFPLHLGWRHVWSAVIVWSGDNKSLVTRSVDHCQQSVGLLS